MFKNRKKLSSFFLCVFFNHALNLSGLEPFTKIVKMDFQSLKYTLEMFSTID